MNNNFDIFKQNIFKNPTDKGLSANQKASNLEKEEKNISIEADRLLSKSSD